MFEVCQEWKEHKGVANHKERELDGRNGNVVLSGNLGEDAQWAHMGF